MHYLFVMINRHLLLFSWSGNSTLPAVVLLDLSLASAVWGDTNPPLVSLTRFLQAGATWRGLETPFAIDLKASSLASRETNFAWHPRQTYPDSPSSSLIGNWTSLLSLPGRSLTRESSLNKATECFRNTSVEQSLQTTAIVNIDHVVFVFFFRIIIRICCRLIYQFPWLFYGKFTNNLTHAQTVFPRPFGAGPRLCHVQPS